MGLRVKGLRSRFSRPLEPYKNLNPPQTRPLTACGILYFVLPDRNTRHAVQAGFTSLGLSLDLRGLGFRGIPPRILIIGS